MSSLLPSPSEFWHARLSVRRLVSPKGTGFVIRLIDTDAEPPRFLVAAQQPGQEQITVTSQPAVHVHHPESELEHRYYSSGHPVPEDLGAVAIQLQQHLDTHPHAESAMEFLQSAK